MSKKKHADKLKKQSNKDPNIYLTTDEQRCFGLTDSDFDSPYVALKYFDPSFQCFSEWSSDQLKQFSNFTQKIQQYRWITITQSGGSTGNKTGFGYTPHKRESLPKKDILNKISEDITLFELRLDQTTRVHGFRMKGAFFLVWIDKDHKIYSM